MQLTNQRTEDGCLERNQKGIRMQSFLLAKIGFKILLLLPTYSMAQCLVTEKQLFVEVNFIINEIHFSAGYLNSNNDPEHSDLV